MKKENISLNDLNLDESNPRLAKMDSLYSASDALWFMQQDKLIALIEDIAENGINPSDSIYVVKEDGAYVVVEGNRRLVALRALASPATVPDAKQRRKVARIKPKVIYTMGSKILCDVYSSREEADHWIDLKHQSSHKGAGTIPWGAEEKYYRQIARGGDRVFAYELWGWIGETYQDKDWIGVWEEAKNKQWTLMKRLATNHFRQCLRLHLRKSGVESDYSITDLEPVMKKIVSDIAEGPLGSRSINNTAEIKEYIDDILCPLLPAQLPAPSALPLPLVKDSKGKAPSLVNRSSVISQNTTKPGKTTPRRTRGVSQTKDIEFIFQGISFNKMPERIQSLAAQAQKIDIDKMPDIAGIMIRVLLDLLVDKHLSVKELTTKNSLEKDVREIIKNFEKDSTKTAISGRFKDLKNRLNDKHSSLHGMVASAHGFLHSNDYAGGAQTVRELSRAWQPFVEFLVTNIEENGK